VESQGKLEIFLSRATELPFSIRSQGLCIETEISLKNARRIKTEFLFWLRKLLLEFREFNLY
jgi:hypothetical protein